MKVLLDTNIIISAALFPNSVTAKAYYKAVSYPYDGIICDWTINELHEVFIRKFPEKISVLDRFLEIAHATFEVIVTPDEEVNDEKKIRDVKDRPILRAAQYAKVDYLLTGDKDFLESGIENPIIINPSRFLEL